MANSVQEPAVHKVCDVKFRGTKRFFAAIKKSDRAEYCCYSLGAGDITIQAYVNQLETAEEGGDQFLQMGAKLLGDYIDLTAAQYREILKYVSERRVHWYRDSSGKERRAEVYKTQTEKSSLRPPPKVEQTDPLAKFVVLLPIDDATPGERNPEIEPSCLDIFPELEKPIKG